MLARMFPRCASASTSLLDVTMLTWSPLKRSFRGKNITSFQIFCNPCHLQHMLLHNDVRK